MVTISHLVKKAVSNNHFLLEAMSKELISYGNLAEQLKPFIEEELDKKVKDSAIVMALRRYAEELHSFDKSITKFKFQGEIMMKTNIMSCNVVKSPRLLNKLKHLYTFVNFERGDTLNVIVGNNEASIITSQKYNQRLLKLLKGEKILHKDSNLVALTIRFGSGNFLSTPGVIFTAVRKLAWESINIYEIVSTMDELTFILHQKDSIKGYSLLQSLVNQ